MLLSHDVAAHQSTVLIDDDGTVAALADGADVALRNTVRVVGVAELIAGLLLHVIGHDTLVGYRCPEVLVTVEVHHVGLTLDTHLGIELLHVALKTLRLRMIDAETCRGLNHQVAVKHLLDADDIAVRQRRAVLRIALEVLERVAVKAVQSCRGAKPHVAALVLQHTVNLTADESVAGVQRLKQVNACRCQRQCKHDEQQYPFQSLHI